MAACLSSSLGFTGFAADVPQAPGPLAIIVAPEAHCVHRTAPGVDPRAHIGGCARADVGDSGVAVPVAIVPIAI